MSRLPLTQAYPFAEEKGLWADVERIRNVEIEWDLSYNSTVRRGYIVELLQKHDLLSEFIDRHWEEGKSRAGQSEVARCLRVKARYEEFLGGQATETEIADEFAGENLVGSEFAAESDLRDYLSKNLQTVEEGLELYQDSRGLGLEYAVDKGRIDILAIDRHGRPLVIELKLSRGHDRTLGQLLYYMGWVDQNLGQGKSRGLIIAREITDQLRLAVSRVPDVSLMRYSLSVTVEKVP